VLASIVGLMAQVFERKDKYVSNKLLTTAIKDDTECNQRQEAETAIKDDTEYHKSKLIQHTTGWRRETSQLDPVAMVLPRGAVVIDDIVGCYWGAPSCDLDQFRHQYLACLSLKIDPQTGKSMLYRFQPISDTCNIVNRALYALKHLTTLHRNLLYINLL
jgi:hypothetical protein